MKKTYDVYSIFGKMKFTALASVFVFSVCFLGVTSEATAQTESLIKVAAENVPAPPAEEANYDFLKEYQFNEADKNQTLELLADQLEVLQTEGFGGEAETGARGVYLRTLIDYIRSENSIEHSTAKAYAHLVNVVNTSYAVYVNTEEIARYYSSLID